MPTTQMACAEIGPWLCKMMVESVSLARSQRVLDYIVLRKIRIADVKILQALPIADTLSLDLRIECIDVLADSCPAGMITKG